MSFCDQVRAGALIIDVRDASEFATSSVSKSINIPLNSLDSFNERDYTKTILVVCATGMRAEFAKNVLFDYGYSNTINAGCYTSLRC